MYLTLDQAQAFGMKAVKPMRKAPCKPGETAASDGCTPASGNAAAKPKPAKKPFLERLARFVMEPSQEVQERRRRETAAAAGKKKPVNNDQGPTQVGTPGEGGWWEAGHGGGVKKSLQLLNAFYSRLRKGGLSHAIAKMETEKALRVEMAVKGGRVTAFRKMKPGKAQSWQTDPSKLTTGKVQLWSSSGTMMGLIPLDKARSMVVDGSAFVMTEQAVGQYDKSSAHAIHKDARSEGAAAFDAGKRASDSPYKDDQGKNSQWIAGFLEAQGTHQENRQPKKKDHCCGSCKQGKPCDSHKAINQADSELSGGERTPINPPPGPRKDASCKACGGVVKAGVCTKCGMKSISPEKALRMLKICNLTAAQKGMLQAAASKKKSLTYVGKSKDGKPVWKLGRTKNIAAGDDAFVNGRPCRAVVKGGKVVLKALNSTSGTAGGYTIPPDDKETDEDPKSQKGGNNMAQKKISKPVARRKGKDDKTPKTPPFESSGSTSTPYSYSGKPDPLPTGGAPGTGKDAGEGADGMDADDMVAKEDHPDPNDAQPYTPKHSAGMLAKLWEHMKNATSYVDEGLNGPHLDHPQIAEGLTKFKDEMIPPMQDYLKGLLDEHHEHPEGLQGDEHMDGILKAMGAPPPQDTGEFPGDGEAGAVADNEVPMEDDQTAEQDIPTDEVQAAEDYATDDSAEVNDDDQGDVQLDEPSGDEQDLISDDDQKDLTNEGNPQELKDEDADDAVSEPTEEILERYRAKPSQKGKTVGKYEKNVKALLKLAKAMDDEPMDDEEKDLNDMGNTAEQVPGKRGSGRGEIIGTQNIAGQVKSGVKKKPFSVPSMPDTDEIADENVKPKPKRKADETGAALGTSDVMSQQKDLTDEGNPAELKDLNDEGNPAELKADETGAALGTSDVMSQQKDMDDDELEEKADETGSALGTADVMSQQKGRISPAVANRLMERLNNIERTVGL
jgi:hypothetical protein